MASAATPTPNPASASPGSNQGAQVTAEAPEAAPPPSLVVGDFDGDGRSDQLWYGPGGSP